MAFKNAAEVENDLVFSPGRLLTGCGQREDHDIGLFVGFLVVGQLKHLVLADIGFHNQEVTVVVALHNTM